VAEASGRIHYEFEGFRLDPQQRLLLAGGDGRPVPLAPKVFDTLLYFLERRGELLDKTTLMKAIWPNVVVEENSLNQNISALRRALGENPGEHRYIVTEPGRGYRFVADVRTVTAAPGGRTAQPSAMPSGGAQPAAARTSIAVLPFANLTGDPSKEYLGDGMAEELIHTLARLPGLRVPSRTSSFAYKGRNIDVRQIASDLQVGAVLEGSVRSAGERIRVTAQLIDAENGYHLWSQSYDRQFEDLFKLQDELASAIVHALRPALDSQAPEVIRTTPRTADLEAYNLYLQAIAVPAITEQTTRLAWEMLERAIERDPHFARAYTALAAMQAIALMLDIPAPGTLEDAERNARRALALDPGMGATHAALGIISALRGRWLQAEEEFQAAFAHDDTDPGNLQAYGAHVLGSAGFLRRHLEVMDRMYRLSPAWFASLVNLAVAQLCLGRHEEAAKAFELAFGMGVPRHLPPIPDVESQIAVRRGRPEDACRIIVNSLSPPLRQAGGVEAAERYFAAVADPRQRGQAIEAVERMRAALGPQNTPQPIKRRLMLWNVVLGDLSRAFEIANESLDYFAKSGTIGAAWGFLWMEEMRPFRQDERFQTFAARMNLFEYWNKFGPPDYCELRGGKLICR
jgi:TolB-like protein